MVSGSPADPTDLIEVLHQVQLREGHLSPAALHRVACDLALPLSRVVGVASFYHLFRRQPLAPQRWTLCFGTACFVLGAPALAAALQTRLTASPAGWRLQRSDCLGACGRWPVLRHNDDLPQAVPLAPASALAAGLRSLGWPEPAPAAGGRP
jgi:bidirectional [NiFe] hydrogenase diaphorase subunit